jgi:hypothetical protein
MNKSNIEQVARDLQNRIWAERQTLWPGRQPHPRECLSPDIAARVLDVSYQQCERLDFTLANGKYETAGILDRAKRTIVVSARFGPEVGHFTGAHEIGHLLLHPGEVMHRDRPIKGMTAGSVRREPREREADYFAACFLVPETLLRDALEFRFLTRIPFVFDDASAFQLCPEDPESLLRQEAGSMARALALATVERYNGRHFHSLAKQFRVSSTTMAIRIQELKMIAVP